MRRDLFIGIFVALAFHGGVAWVGEHFKPHGHKHIATDDSPKIELMEMPKIEPDEPEKTDTDEQQAAPSDIAPPMQTDVPQLVQLDSFVQPVQPPPPEGLKANAGIIAIPQGRPSGLGKGVAIFDPSMLDQQPVARLRIPPQYPFEMKRAGITGEVLIEFIIDVNGEVKNPTVVKSTQREFENAALLAVAKWKFTPGKKGGRPVNSRRQQPISFTLNED